MAPIAARKAREIVDNTRKIIAIEFLCAAQGISLITDELDDLELATATGEAYEKIREKIPATGEDRFVSKQMKIVYDMVTEDELK